MTRTHMRLAIPLSLLGCLPAMPAAALLPAVYTFSTGSPDGLMATASRPESAGKLEIETADDFVLTTTTSINSATFTGLLTGDGSVSNVRVEIYHVFPLDSKDPPSGHVPTRANSPSDNELLDVDSASGGLRFTMTTLAATFTADNSVQPRGINPSPPQTTGGDGPVIGKEVEFDVSFTHGLLLPANHYFFVPQVEVTDANGNFFWLSATKTIPAPADLQSWTRDEGLDPDWLRVGTDIVGAVGEPPTVTQFNASFSLKGTVVPEPSSWAMMLLGFGGLGYASWRRAGKSRRQRLTQPPIPRPAPRPR
jgi:PEP-CTERM motif